MPDIADDRQNILQEETRYRAAVSESTWTKIGASINFINNQQFDSKTFQLNGVYPLAVTESLGTEGVDGIWVVQNNIEITGVFMYNLVNGSSGTTALDVHLLDGSNNDIGSIFSTTPKIASTAGDNAYLYLDNL